MGIIQFRRSLASWFGRREHLAGELLGLCLITESLLYKDIKLYIPTALWLIYFVSHRLEKKIYGKVGFR